MSRFPRVRFEADIFADVDAVYLTHAHCDHLDPYTLTRLWNELDKPPTLIIPISLGHLIPLCTQYLKGLEIIVLKPHSPIVFKGVEFLGFFDVGYQPNNEEDVMILVLTHEQERILVEADARLGLELVHFRQFVSMLLRAPHLETAVYLTTENELSGTMEGRNCSSIEERQALFEYAFEELHTSIEQLYVPFDDPMDLWKEKHLIRLIHGQGLTAPHELDERWQKILFPVRIDDRVQAEREVAERYGYEHSIDALHVGHTHTIVAGEIVDKHKIGGLTILDNEEQRIFELNLPFFPELPCAPLRMNLRDVEQQRVQIIALLNTCFLPFLLGLRQPPVLHLLSEHQGMYRIQIHYGSVLHEQSYDYTLSFEQMSFVEAKSNMEPAHEAYWANDLIDFLEGYCDEFSTFSRRQIPAPYMRLWAAMATPLLNSDMMKRRLELHFERAAQGLSPSSWVLEMYESISI